MSDRSLIRSPDACPSCGDKRLTSFSAHAHDGLNGETVAILECLVCHFAWQATPLRTAVESVKHFETAYRPSASEPSGYFGSAYKLQVVDLELQYLESLPVDGRKVLDVGGGSGAFAVAAAARGWQASTVDPALDAAHLSSVGVSAYKGFLSALPRDERFHAATLWDVIEHVEKPRSFLQEVRGHLLPGAVVVLSTGNYKSVDRVSAGRTHWIYQLDHRWYFSPESLSLLLQDAGFEIFASCNRVLRPGWSGHEQYRGSPLRSLLSSAVREPLQVSHALKRFLRIRQAMRWPQSGLAIFTVAARLA